MTSSSDANDVTSTSSTDVVVHTVELDRGGGAVQEGSSSSTGGVQVVVGVIHNASFSS